MGFLNTLFSLSEGCMYCQLVDLLDRRQIPEILGYADLYERVRRVLDEAHMEGRVKAEIIASPEKYVLLEEEIPHDSLGPALLGQKTDFDHQFGVELHSSHDDLCL